MRLGRDAAGRSTGAGRSRLSTKYTLALAILLTGALIASDAIHGYFAYSESQRALVRIQRAEARAAAARITSFLDEVERQIGSVAAGPRPAGQPGADQRQTDYLRLVRLQPAIGEIAYLDPSGREQLRVSLAGSTVLGSGDDYSTASAFVVASSGRIYRGPIYFRWGSEPFMTIALPDVALDGGATVAEINLTLIWDIVSQLTIGEHGYAYVADARGQLIAHPHLSLVLRQTDVSHLLPVQGWLARQPGDVGEPTIAPDLSGQSMLSVAEAVQSTGWLVVTNQPVGEALEPLTVVLWRTALLVLLGVSLALVASVLLARRLVAPILVLQQTAARIGAGALDQRMEVRTGDELEMLADEFNRMGAQLRASHADLERKVEDRTRELAAVVRALEEKSGELEIASRHKTEFLANMSHELRTPLNAIIGFAEILIDRPAAAHDERETRYLTNILIAGRHLLALINEILDVAKIEAGRVDLEIRRFSLADAIESSVIWIQERAARRRTSVTLDVDPLVGMVEADERKIKQVLVNLLSNAVKFTPERGQVEVRAWRADGEARVSVRDTGIGIEPADRERIFAAFEQATRAMPAGTEGTGLGLAISRRFVELHGGRIWVESVLGTGSTFTFAIPLRQAGSTALDVAPPDVADAQAARTGGDWDSVAAGMSAVRSTDDDRPKILVIDNHPMAIEVIEAALTPEGYHVIPALGGEPGIRLAMHEAPRLIILDLIMPDMDGFIVLQRLRAATATADIPVIVLTSKSLSSEERARLAGHVRHIGQKGDFDRSAFLDLVQRHIAAGATIAG
jgi:signal transduction histidine kinase